MTPSNTLYPMQKLTPLACQHCLAQLKRVTHRDAKDASALFVSRLRGAHLSGMTGMCMASLMCPEWMVGSAVCGRTLAWERCCSRGWRAKSSAPGA